MIINPDPKGIRLVIGYHLRCLPRHNDPESLGRAGIHKGHHMPKEEQERHLAAISELRKELRHLEAP